MRDGDDAAVWKKRLQPGERLVWTEGPAGISAPTEPR